MLDTNTATTRRWATRCALAVLVCALASAGAAAACTPGAITGLEVNATTPHCYVVMWNADACAVRYDYTLRPGGYINVTIDLSTENNFLTVGAPNAGTAGTFEVRGIGPNGEQGPSATIIIRRSSDWPQ